MASEPIECQVLVLRVSIHCEGCKKKVKKVLQNVHGVLRCDIDARANKVVVTASTKVDPNVLVAKLRKSGKQAELWPEQPPAPQQQPPPAEGHQSQEETNKNPTDEPTGNKPAENDEAAEPSNPSQQEPKQSNASDGAPTPAPPERKEASHNGGDEATAAAGAGQQQPRDAAKGKAKQHQQPVDARVTVEYYDRGGDGYRGMPAAAPQPIMSYNMARPSASASYYASPPAPAMARMPPGPQPPHQGYIDEHYTPSYYGGRSSPPPAYEPYYYNYPPPQPSSSYGYQYQHQPASASTTDDYYYYSAPPPPQRSAFSPPREGYGDMFNDENANSCAVM